MGAREAGGRTAAHLAALTGDVVLAAAVAGRSRTAGPCRHEWGDADGRTPLHYAAFFDCPELAQAFSGLCDPAVVDKWGCTALDLARDLGHHSAAAVLPGGLPGLQELCGQRVLRALRGPGDVAELLASLQLPEGTHLAGLVPLHEHGALRKLAAALPGAVDPTALLRSMSCLECWHAELLGRNCGAALPGCLELIRAWDDLDSFRSAMLPDDDTDDGGAVLARVPGRRAAPAVADRETFLERFHRRTGHVLANMDWSNLLVIGGMVLACLTADDEEYARNFKETDVDIYVVGLSGESFKERVAELVSSLPEATSARDFTIYLDRELELHAGDAGISVMPHPSVHGALAVTAVQGAVATWNEKHPDQRLSVGDLIVKVDGAEGDTTEMTEVLQSKATCTRLRSTRHFEPKVIVARPKHMATQLVSATVLRTPQTLTACIREHSGRPLPNVQVVLAPYASPAHLLFTTDIDCTAMAFDGQELLATPRAREAIRRRRNVARPEKYMVRGEWRTEARLLKYAARGFRVVDLGMQPGASAPRHAAMADVAAKAELLLGQQRGAGGQEELEGCVRSVQATGVHGAQLLLLAARERGLRRLMLHEVPRIRAGMDLSSLISLVVKSRVRRGLDYEEEDGQREHADAVRTVEYCDGYGKARSTLVLVNPASLSGRRLQDGRLRGNEVSLREAIEELDLESDRFEVRSWYDGIPAKQLRQPHAHLDPAEWKGAGDFRSVP
mmetsp:Transcript_34095/g.102823  ORF Transcript_34095/g.102823 Transcript_34095/m.102823 type:complete len:731 (+) Transcript_34095:722-2914(+)